MTDSHIHTRPAAVAGLFYTADPAQLKSEVRLYLDNASTDTQIPPKAIIAPHAGYIYSGPVAASAYALLKPVADKIKQVVVLGPSHRVAFEGVATPDADYFETPLGKIKINQHLCQSLNQLDFVFPNNRAHQDEHSLEVQLPFLQSVLSDFELTPLVVGNCRQNDVAHLLDQVWGDAQTLIVISSDLSHYHEYSSAQKLDLITSEAITHLEPEKIHYDNACGRNPLNGLLTLARSKQLKVDLLDLRNSGDTAGSKDRVVGYGAYAVH